MICEVIETVNTFICITIIITDIVPIVVPTVVPIIVSIRIASLKVIRPGGQSPICECVAVRILGGVSHIGIAVKN